MLSRITATSAVIASLLLLAAPSAGAVPPVDVPPVDAPPVDVPAPADTAIFATPGGSDDDARAPQADPGKGTSPESNPEAEVEAPTGSEEEDPAEKTIEELDPDPEGGASSSLAEGESPSCKNRGLDATTKHNCERSRSISRPYPLSSYGIDNHVEVGAGNLTDVLPLSVHWLLTIVWQGLLHVINGILLLLEWTFSLDLVGDSMGDVREALAHFNDEVLGQAWMLAAISIAGLWGIWNGLVRLRTVDTIVGLGTVLLMMGLALMIIHQPGATIGQLSALSNQASTDALSLVSSGKIEDGANGYADASQRLFNTVVMEPWCALQFGDVGYCYERPGKICEVEQLDFRPDRERCKDFDGTVADAWLSHPAGSKQRAALWRSLKESDPGRARIQGVGGTADRVGLLVLIAIGLAGAAALFMSIGLRLVFTGVGVLGLLLAAPVVLVLPAFGEAGRKAFSTWLKRLAGCAVGQFVYAIFLAIVILIAGLIAGLDGLGWHARWMVLIAFFWGLFQRREELVGFVMPASQRGGGILGNVYYATWLGGTVGRTVAAGPRRVAQIGAGGVRRARNRLGRQRDARDAALGKDAQQELWRRGAEELRSQRASANQEAERIVRRAAADRRRKTALRTDLRTADQGLADAQRRQGAQRRRVKAATDPAEKAAAEQLLLSADRNVAASEAKRNKLLAEREGIDARLDDPRLGWAEATVRRHGGRNEVSDREVRDWVRNREAELSGGRNGDPETARDQAHRSLLERSDTRVQSRAARRAAREELEARPERGRSVRDWSRAELRAAARGRGRRGMGRR